MISMICSSNLLWMKFKRFSISCTVNDNFNNTPFIIITILFYIDRAPRDICILRSQVVYRCIQLVFPVHNTLCVKQVYIQVFLGLNLDRIPYPERVVGALPFSSKVWTSSWEKTGPITSTTVDFSFQNFLDPLAFGQVLIFDILVELSLVSKDGLLEEEKMVQHLVGTRTLMLFWSPLKLRPSCTCGGGVEY